jgi:hypothetical protein
MSAARITKFGGRGDAAHDYSFEVDGISVLVLPYSAADDKKAMLLAQELASAVDAKRHQCDAEVERLLASARRAAEAAEERLRALVPPAGPPRLLGVGCVRFRGDELWLLSRRDRGWGEFGIPIGSWDDLFRRYNVRVTAHGVDAHGLWFEVRS